MKKQKETGETDAIKDETIKDIEAEVIEDVENIDYAEDILSEEEACKVSEIQREFLESYAAAKDKMEVDEWLPQELQKQLPDKSHEEIQEMSGKIVSSLKITEEMKVSQQKAIQAGRSKESWLASTLLQATSHMSMQESEKYLRSLDEAVNNANAAMRETITTKSSGYSLFSQNPNLDGFIAEQHHVNSFNMDAAAKGSRLRAEIQPFRPGETYTKNGFDVIIKDDAGHRIHQYQMKYGATAEDTIRMLKSGNYNNQSIVVPEEQVAAVQEAFPNKTVTATIGEGNIQSKPLTKETAKQLQEQAQNGKLKSVDWNEYVAKDIAKRIAQETGTACLQGAVIGAGMAVAGKVINGEAIDGEEVVETALTSGADFGIKTATAGALKAASEKGMLAVLPKGTPADTFTNIAFVAVENVKVAGKIATGELTTEEGIDVMQQTTGSCIAGIAASETGAAIGTTIGSVFGPVGTIVGNVAGRVIGYAAGSKVGQAVVQGVQKIRNVAREKAEAFVENTKYVVGSACDGVKSFVGGVVDFVGSIFGF